MRYILAARVRPERRAELLRALENGSFGRGFPYGDLGEVLGAGRVDASGTIRWVEVCYCREYYGVAMHEELPYLEDYLTDIEVADARAPRYCKGYPECNDCPCTRKVRFEGEPLRQYLRRTVLEGESAPVVGRSTRWLGWRGQVGPEEARRNRNQDAKASPSAMARRPVPDSAGETDMLKVSGILETALYVDDLPRSAEFYRRLFGFTTLLESERLIALSVADRNVLLLFLKGASTEPTVTPGGVIPPHDGSGQLHFAFSVADEDVGPWEERLKAEGVAIESTVTWPRGGRSLYFRDPDGHLVELISPGWWSIY